MLTDFVKYIPERKCCNFYK
ncbi:hypothetical protein VULLAG_LOCUS419 [Vulpes lagopus]